MKRLLFYYLFLFLPLLSCQRAAEKTGQQDAPATSVAVTQTTVTDPQQTKNPYYSRTDTTKLHVSDAEWKKVLSPDVYYISRKKGTERAFTGKLWNFTGRGTYYCAACGNKLFRSDAKFASDCGWPSFFETIRKKAVIYQADNSFGMERIEVLCGRCDGHLGHLFDDGPEPTGKRYCMNSVALNFEPDGAFPAN
ncbi:peptide-methionine (R)-S-oxide reductase MsrB [Rufibacter latericius]|uniref:peptide-methionine (R)-S-oxide reductase n=1 Tax=Rufibacter latericius TaxID=2487040 RepID=A0A3M9MJP7_9BACT|nr:peptide-methionine (R)-S-oxide reductase MsrB [Rufibacter latericius]RNI25779.1 peptide-methionine (R)-S-oxide reductase [Rufibacter latericius]